MDINFKSVHSQERSHVPELDENPNIDAFLRVVVTTLYKQLVSEISDVQLAVELREAGSMLLQHCVKDKWPGVMTVIIKNVINSFDDWRRSHRQLTN